VSGKPARFLRAAIALALFGGAAVFLRHALRDYRYHDIVDSLRAIPAARRALALALTAASYWALTAYDALAVRAIGRALAYRRVAFAAFVGQAFSQSIGLALVTASSIRYRLYTAWGLSAVEVTNVVAFATLTFWLGFAAAGAALFLIAPPALPAALHLPFADARPLGAVLLAAVLGYFAWSVLIRRPVRVRDWEFPPPAPPLAALQVAVAALDWSLSGMALYALLPPELGVAPPAFLGIFLLAQVLGLLSSVPGGLGVFESAVLALLPAAAPRAAVLGALLAYRAIYYLAPLGAAALLLGGHELERRREALGQAARAVGRGAAPMAPQVFAATTFVSGALLLFSGATPGVHSRLAFLREVLPLPVIELSHFLASLAGMGLLLLARGLQRRLDAAYLLTAGFLGAGVVLSLAKGFDWEEALVMAAMLAALLPCRRHFYRRASLLSERFSAGWISAILVAIVGTVWLGAFSWKHVEFSQDLWWRFALAGGASRFLRASVGAVALAAAFAAARLLRAVDAEPAPPGGADLERAAAIVASSTRTSAALALMGDKSLLFSESGASFLMYGVEGRSWVALGDPVGPAEERAELVWRFRELCDQNGAFTVFYEVESENLHLYLDLGLTLLKLGEEASVPLGAFSLEGKARKSMRHAVNRHEKEGYAFRVLAREAVPALMPELKRVSDAWLGDKNTREKRFSLGCFDPAYLARFPAAVVEREGRIVAFANLFFGGEKEELSLDLMRYEPSAESGVMEYLFVKLMLWGKEEGYRAMNLGMAPLSGLEGRPLAPLWNRLGSLLFRHGEQFYNFQGLREYKAKFDPVWTPKYLASPAGLALPRILANIAALISGGVKGVVAK
jgi:phosphatidylglycerol lysyltransferase